MVHTTKEITHTVLETVHKNRGTVFKNVCIVFAVGVIISRAVWLIADPLEAKNLRPK
jgi:hypothetical protein